MKMEKKRNLEKLKRKKMNLEKNKMEFGKDLNGFHRALHIYIYNCTPPPPHSFYVSL